MDMRPEFGLRAWEGQSCDGFMNRAGHWGWMMTGVELGPSL